MPNPTYRFTGAQAVGTGPITPAYPAAADLTIGERGYLEVQSANQTVTLSDAQGFVLVGSAGVGTAGAAGATRVTVFEGPVITSTTPTPPTVADSGDHQAARIHMVRDMAKLVTGVEQFVTDTLGTPSANVSLPAVGTPPALDGCLFVYVLGHAIKSAASQVSTSWSNPSGLGAITKRYETSTSQGVGGGVAVATATQTTKQAVGSAGTSLLSASNQAMLVLVIRPEPPAAVADEAMACGAECNAQAQSGGHIDAFIGTPPVSQTDIALHGGRAWLCAPVNDVSGLAWDITGTKRPFTAYLYFDELPTGDCELVRFRVASGGNSPELRFIKATNSIVGAIGSQLTTAVPVIAGTFYLVDLEANVGVNPRTLKLTVDTVSKGTASLAVAAGTLNRIEVGASLTTPTTARVIWDDLYFDVDAATSYPIGAGETVFIQLASDGTHNYNAVGDLKYDNVTDVPLSATDLWSRTTGLLDNAVGWIAYVGAVLGEYWEGLFGGMPAVTSIQGVEAIFVIRAATTDPNKQAVRLIDGGTTVTVFTDQHAPGAGPFYVAKHYKLAPSGVAWTQALVNGLKMRAGPGFTGTIDTVPVPGLAGVGLEVRCVKAGAPPVPIERQQNPLKVYASAGTRNVTLTVTDDSGLKHSVTKAVVVP